MTLVTAIGWVANGCFFARFFVQWLDSERAGRSTSPRAFWWLSLVGSLFLLVYLSAVDEVLLMVGGLINASIYARNLWYQRGSHVPARLDARFVGVAALAGVSVLTGAAVVQAMTKTDSSSLWLVCALVGQCVWSSRFVLQWWLTEKRQESHFPPAFWWTSLAGNALLLSYALHLSNAVLVAAYVVGPFVQVRNLMLTYARRGDAAQGAEHTG